MQSRPAIRFLLSALVGAGLIPLQARAGDNGTAAIVGTWTAEAQGRAQGVCINTLSQERSTAGMNTVVVHEMQLAGKR